MYELEYHSASSACCCRELIELCGTQNVNTQSDINSINKASQLFAISIRSLSHNRYSIPHVPHFVANQWNPHHLYFLLFFSTFLWDLCYIAIISIVVLFFLPKFTLFTCTHMDAIGREKNVYSKKAIYECLLLFMLFVLVC